MLFHTEHLTERYCKGPIKEEAQEEHPSCGYNLKPVVSVLSIFLLSPIKRIFPPLILGITAAESPDTISCFVRISLLQDGNISVLCL